MRQTPALADHVAHILSVCAPVGHSVRLRCVIEQCGRLPEPPREAALLLVMSTKTMTEEKMAWTKQQQTFWVFTAAFFLIIVLALLVSSPTPYQFMMFRWFSAIACAGMGASIPGFLSVEIKAKLGKNGTVGISALGAIAIFVIIYLINPPSLIHK